MHDNLARLETELMTVLSGLTEREAQSTPLRNPARWTIQQIVEHLLLTYQSTRSLVEVRLQKGTTTQAKPSIAQRVGQFTLITLGYFPPGRPAPAAVCPGMSTPPQSGAQLTRRLCEEVLALDRALADAESLFSERAFASHFILGPLSSNEWRKFHLVHGIHHARQIGRIRRQYQAQHT